MTNRVIGLHRAASLRTKRGCLGRRAPRRARTTQPSPDPSAPRRRKACWPHVSLGHPVRRAGMLRRPDLGTRPILPCCNYSRQAGKARTLPFQREPRSAAERGHFRRRAHHSSAPSAPMAATIHNHRMQNAWPIACPGLSFAWYAFLNSGRGNRCCGLFLQFSQGEVGEARNVAPENSTALRGVGNPPFIGVVVVCRYTRRPVVEVPFCSLLGGYVEDNPGECVENRACQASSVRSVV